MKLTKKSQYALLFMLYLARSGRANAQAISLNLNIDNNFLNQIALKLKKSGLIRSYMGPGGGYELIGDPRVQDVLAATGSPPILTPDEVSVYKRGGTETRALASLVSKMTSSMLPPLHMTIRGVIKSLVTFENARFDSINPESKVN